MPERFRARVLVLALPALLVPVACTGDDSPGSPITSGPGPETVAGGLAVLPDRGEDETVLWTDLARAAELAGVDAPENADDPDAVVDYSRAITGPHVQGEPTPIAALPPEAAAHQMLARVDEVEDELGWSLADITQVVERQTPPDVITVMNGSFDDERLDAALGEPEGDAARVLGDPDGDMQLDDVTPARPLGESLWTARTDDGLVVTRGSDSTGDVRAALEGDPAGPTLADDAGLAALAGALDAEEAYSAMLVRPGVEFGDQALSPAAREAACADALPEAPVATATGIADDDGPVVLVAHAHADADAARSNASALEEMVTEGASLSTREPWSDRFTLDGVEVTGPGDTVVVGRLRPVDDVGAHLWYQVLTTADSLVAHC